MGKLLAWGVLILVVATGCTTSSVGQVVTNVSSDGRGGLIVEKGTVKLRKYMWSYVTDVSIEGFHTTTLAVGGD